MAQYKTIITKWFLGTGGDDGRSNFLKTGMMQSSINVQLTLTSTITQIWWRDSVFQLMITIITDIRT